jgi:hypothetical protein
MATRWRNTLEVAVTALVVINALELAFVFKLHSDARLYDTDLPFPLPSGYLVDMKFTDSEAPCYLVRLSSDSCPYCLSDQELYKDLSQRARQFSCRTILLAPKMGQMKSSDASSGIVPLQFVDMKFGRALNPFITPQTILLDRKGGILWDREGAMDKRALSNALRSLEKAR